MSRFLLTGLATVTSLALGTLATPALAADSDVDNTPPPAPYQAVSDLVELPDFIPGLGELYVDPDTLPAGPFLGYDHDGKLTTTTYMIPLSAMEADMDFNDLQVPADAVDHVDIDYNAGHPGVEEPHIHIVLWHVSAEDEDRVAE